MTSVITRSIAARRPRAPVLRTIASPIQEKIVEKVEEKSAEVAKNDTESQQKPVESDNFRSILNCLIKPSSKRDESDFEHWKS